MPTIIGGSASTGSSLLTNILNRHSSIYAGPETHLFTKPKLYLDWAKHKESILTKQGDAMKSPGIHRFNGVILDNQKPIADLLNEANSFPQFAEAYFSSCGAIEWVEKTPVNSYCFDLFIKEFKGGKCVLMVRNPYDAIASMMARGLTSLKAASIYLTNTLANISLRGNDNFHIVKYESLITNTKHTLSELCNFLGIMYESEMLIAEDEDVRMEGWIQNEKGELGKGSVGRFLTHSASVQNEIISVVDSIKLRNEKWPFTSTELRDISDICNLFNYEYRKSEGESISNKLYLWKEELESTIKFYPTNIFNYPITFK